ncbi:DEAD-box ATP-dependent RNA helicase 7 [Tanacetum coccineum]
MWDGVGEQPYMLNARDVVAEKDSFVNPDGDQCSHDLQDVLCSPSCPPGCCNDICVKRFGQNAKGLYGCTQKDVERGPLLRLGSGARVAAMSANPIDLLQGWLNVQTDKSSSHCRGIAHALGSVLRDEDPCALYTCWFPSVMLGNLDFSSLKVRILDEADEMLRQSFVEDVEYILGNSGVAITLYEPRKANISKLEREVVKLEHVSAPQLSDIARAAGLDAAEAILRVSDSSEIAQQSSEVSLSIPGPVGSRLTRYKSFKEGHKRIEWQRIWLVGVSISNGPILNSEWKFCKNMHSDDDQSGFYFF